MLLFAELLGGEVLQLFELLPSQLLPGEIRVSELLLLKPLLIELRGQQRGRRRRRKQWPLRLQAVEPLGLMVLGLTLLLSDVVLGELLPSKMLLLIILLLQLLRWLRGVQLLQLLLLFDKLLLTELLPLDVLLLG